MPYIPHTREDVSLMLNAVGADSLESLFSSIPDGLRLKKPLDLPEGMPESEVARSVSSLLSRNVLPRMSFAGAGAYEHYVPAAVQSIASRGEFLTAYTPYQPEASQGALQVFFEFQTMIARLTGLDAANASLYEAGSALAEAVLMASRQVKGRRVLTAAGLNPNYLKVLKTYVNSSGLSVETVPEKDGVMDLAAAGSLEDACALVVQQPNFYGCLEPCAAASALARKAGLITIGVVNPVSLGLLKAPGEWGADIAVGDIQPLGLPPSFGGPYAGFMATRRELMRRMPGRIVGMTTDAKGRRGFVLTMQAREQHIRREKASSNICTNEAWCALLFTVAASLVGGAGLARMAASCAAKARKAARLLSALPGVEMGFNSAFFHEFVLRLPCDAAKFCRHMATEHGIVPGVPLSRFHRTREREILVCVTETKRQEDIEELSRRAGEALAAMGKGRK